MYFGHDFLPNENPNLKVVEGDIRDTEKFKKLVKERILLLI